ncbi:MAG TPA: pseudouridine synthase [Cellvibrionaceae bacterium]
MRLDKFIANNTQLSRREVLYALRRGAISINGETANNIATKISLDQNICLDGTPITERGGVYLMLHKPAGVVSVSHDSIHPTALDLIDNSENLPLQIAGRLDIDTTGLLLITDDGAWNHQLTAPRSGKQKRYRVHTAEPITEEAITKFAEGVALHNEPRLTRPATLQIIAPTEALVILSEGKYHQVRRMFAAVGNYVIALHREAIGNIELDPALAPGQYRPLSAEEIASV